MQLLFCVIMMMGNIIMIPTPAEGPGLQLVSAFGSGTTYGFSRGGSSPKCLLLA